MGAHSDWAMDIRVHINDDDGNAVGDDAAAADDDDIKLNNLNHLY